MLVFHSLSRLALAHRAPRIQDFKSASDTADNWFQDVAGTLQRLADDLSENNRQRQRNQQDSEENQQKLNAGQAAIEQLRQQIEWDRQNAEKARRDVEDAERKLRDAEAENERIRIVSVQHP